MSDALTVPKAAVELINKLTGEPEGGDTTAKLTLITFTRLECDVTEDTWGKDDFILQIYIDDMLQGVEAQEASLLGQVMAALPGIVGAVVDIDDAISAGIERRGRLNNGESAAIKVTLPFIPGRSMSLKLWDEDDIDADDLLANITIRQSKNAPEFVTQKGGTPFPMPESMAQPKIWMCGDDASYLLHYSLTTVDLAGKGTGAGPTGPKEDGPTGIKVLDDLIEDMERKTEAKRALAKHPQILKEFERVREPFVADVAKRLKLKIKTEEKAGR